MIADPNPCTFLCKDHKNLGTWGSCVERRERIFEVRLQVWDTEIEREREREKKKVRVVSRTIFIVLLLIRDMNIGYFSRKPK